MPDERRVGPVAGRDGPQLGQHLVLPQRPAAGRAACAGARPAGPSGRPDRRPTSARARPASRPGRRRSGPRAGARTRRGPRARPGIGGPAFRGRAGLGAAFLGAGLLGTWPLQARSVGSPDARRRPRSVVVPERFTARRWRRRPLSPSVRRPVLGTPALQSCLTPAVRGPERFPGGCSFGAPPTAAGTLPQGVDGTPRLPAPARAAGDRRRWRRSDCPSGGRGAGC